LFLTRRHGPKQRAYEETHSATIQGELGRLRRASPSGASPFYRTIQRGLKTLQDEASEDDPADPTVNVLLIVTDAGDNPSREDRNPVRPQKINSLLGRTRDVAVVTTAAYDRSCKYLAADERVPELREPPHRCHTVGVHAQIESALEKIVNELKDARKR